VSALTRITKMSARKHKYTLS